MIIDEPFELAITPIAKVSCNGEFFEGTILVFQPPKPRMAQDLFKLRAQFNQINREVADMILKQSTEVPSAPTVEAGSPVEAVHEQYAEKGDNTDQAKREKLLEEIEGQYRQYLQIMGILKEVDLFKLTSDFGKMIVNYNLCKVKGKENQTALTSGLWSDSVAIHDRVRATVKYCCFFGLTSTFLP